MKRLMVGTVFAAALVLAPARVLAAPHVVVWSGGLAPGTTAHGVELRPDGSGQRLLADVHGKVATHGSFAPRGATLAGIRAAAERVLAHGPNVTRAPIEDGSYVTVAVVDGSRRRLVLDTGTDSATVAALLHRLNAVLPRGSRVPSAEPPGPAHGLSPALFARAARLHAPTTASCPPGQHPTEVVKQVSLQQAAAAGLVAGLPPKHTIGGDAVGINASWDQVPGPTTITVHLEVSGPDHAEAKVRAELEGRTPEYSVDGQPVSVRYDVVTRVPGVGPRPCYHEVMLTNVADDNGDPMRSYVTGLGPDDVQSGVWSESTPEVWPHEAGHLIGVGDGYSDVFAINDLNREGIPLPENGLEGEDLQRALPPDVEPSDGRITSVANAPDGNGDHDNDLMAGTGTSMREGDLAAVVANADVNIHADPGLVLLDKDVADQNLVVGAPFDLRVPKDGRAELDGIVAYCIDLTDRGSPGNSGSAGYDVLGMAGALGGPATSALQRVAEVVAAREPGPLEETPGANAAIWRVTNDAPVDADADPAAASILQAAGVPLDPADERFDAPHFVDPAAAIPHPVALRSPTDPTPLSPPPAPKPVRGLVLSGSKLQRLRMAPRRLRVARSVRVVPVVATVTLGGQPDMVRVSLTQRHRGRVRTVARSRVRRIPAGQASIVIYARHLKPGTYGVLARGAHSGQVKTTLTVTRR